MSVTKLIISYGLTFLVFLATDLLWLGFIAKNLYQHYLNNFLSPEVNWTAAIIFYLLFVLGITIFAIDPAVKQDSFRQAIIWGALFGFFTYATYDLTNLATMKNWPLNIVLIDLAWGSFIAALTAGAGYHIFKLIR